MPMDTYPTYFEKDNITSGYSPTKMSMFNTYIQAETKWSPFEDALFEIYIL